MTDSNILSPSTLPNISSLARSGWGMSPTTLRSRLQIPAMLLRLPFGFAVSKGFPDTSVYRKMTRSSFSNSSMTSGAA